MKARLWIAVLLASVLVTGCAGHHAHVASASDGPVQSPAASNSGAASEFVAVDGEVRGPGNVAFRPDLTLIGAINTRGGFTDNANRQQIRLIRENQVTIIDCVKATTIPGQDPDVFPGDRIFVPRK